MNKLKVAFLRPQVVTADEDCASLDACSEKEWWR